ncbi:MAG: hypothetical protein JL50_00925 [Peptococcaceae bacterium BICA1-7]|nr:MAG: hypothetical protein JL50_00925 [Peptococcaceae bacterium BICA1-7]HBV98048.1 hypothetical protein [Desulfotomaculum sp.]
MGKNQHNNKKTKKLNKGKILSDSTIKSGIINAILVSVLSITLSLLVNIYFIDNNTKQHKEKNAAILYTDMCYSKSVIESELIVLSKENYDFLIKEKTISRWDRKKLHIYFAQVPYSNIDNTYTTYLTELRPFLTADDYKNILTYYNNIRGLEKLRSDIILLNQTINNLDSKNTETKNKIATSFDNYYFQLQVTYLAFYNESNLEATLNKLSNLSNIKNANYKNDFSVFLNY